MPPPQGVIVRIIERSEFMRIMGGGLGFTVFQFEQSEFLKCPDFEVWKKQ